jgi:DNA-binding MarR family transcriptional regulator
MPARSPDALAEKEFSLIQEIARSPSCTQRELSTSTGLSLGMTNLLIKRLARKGYIKISQLDWKRTQYLLTFKGAVEKARKSYNYSLYTIRIFKQIRENIYTALRREYAAGHRRFTVVGQDEILDLIKEALLDLDYKDAEFAFVKEYSAISSNDVILTATLEAPPASRNGQKFITLVDFENINFRISP